MNIFNFIIIYSILTISIIGYGFLFSVKFTKYNSIVSNKISIGFIGIFKYFSVFNILSLKSLFPHNNLHNLNIYSFWCIIFYNFYQMI